MHSLGTHPVVGGNHRRPDVQRLPHGDRIAVVQCGAQQQVAFQRGAQRYRVGHVAIEQHVVAIRLALSILRAQRPFQAARARRSAGRRAGGARRIAGHRVDLHRQIVLRLQQSDRQKRRTVRAQERCEPLGQRKRAIRRLHREGEDGAYALPASLRTFANKAAISAFTPINPSSRRRTNPRSVPGAAVRPGRRPRISAGMKRKHRLASRQHRAEQSQPQQPRR